MSLPLHEVHGSGPYLFVGWPLRASTHAAEDDASAAVRERYLDSLQGYSVVLMGYPPTRDRAAAVIDSFTPERVCADVLEVADAVGADRFAWYGYSWGGVVGLQLAARTERLAALVCGGWPPLGAPYEEIYAWSEAKARHTGLPDWKMTATYYRGLVMWPEREALSRMSCPRMAFGGVDDIIVDEGYTFRVGPLLAEHRNELEEMGWTVHLVERHRHDLFKHPDVVVSLVRDFLDPLLACARVTLR